MSGEAPVSPEKLLASKDSPPPLDDVSLLDNPPNDSTPPTQVPSASNVVGDSTPPTNDPKDDARLKHADSAAAAIVLVVATPRATGNILNGAGSALPSMEDNKSSTESFNRDEKQVALPSSQRGTARGTARGTTGSLKASGVLTRMWDFEGVGKNEELFNLIAKKGKGPEKIIYSGFETKVNRRKQRQKRLLVITEKAIYNIGPPDFKVVKRRILLHKISGISQCEEAKEFVVHVFEEYDYRYCSERAELIVDVLQYEYKRVARRNLEVISVEQSSLDKITLTRVKALSRAQWKESRAQLLGLCDNEDFKKDVVKEHTDLLGAQQLAIAADMQVVDTQNKTLEDFDIMKVIGRGALGKVVLVQERASKKIYAMKILKKAAVYDKHQVEHVRLEREIMETFQHPFLVGLRFAFQNENRLYLVMDFYKGGELYFHLQRKKKFVEDEVRTMAGEIALGLGHLHSIGYAYRDLKPENILMDEKGHVVLTDFNTVRKFERDDERAYSFIGTPEYMAPEVIKCTGHTTAVDWWCLGVLLFELTCGVTPFVSNSIDSIYEKILSKNPIKFPPRMSEELVDLISKLLVHDPDKRLGSGPEDVEEIKKHPFFRSLKWDRVLAKETIPVYRPPLEKSADSTLNFKAEVVAENVADSYVSTNKNLTDAEEFKRWTFNKK
jgi:serum/glucocorticoid-regulated kinase 2